MNRPVSLIAGAVLATTLFVGCGNDANSGSGGSTKAYCTRIAAFKAKSNDLGAVFSGKSDSAQVKDAFTAIQSMVHDLRKDAPAEIKKDVGTMSTAIDSVVKILAKYDYDFAKLAAAPDFATLTADLNGDEMTAASGRLQAYSTNICGIAPDTSTT